MDQFQGALIMTHRDGFLRRHHELPEMATGGSAQMRGFAIGVGSKADIGAPPRTQLSLENTTWPGI